MMFDEDEGLFIFAATKLKEMLEEFEERYYPAEFPISD